MSIKRRNQRKDDNDFSLPNSSYDDDDSTSIKAQKRQWIPSNIKVFLLIVCFGALSCYTLIKLTEFQSLVIKNKTHLDKIQGFKLIKKCNRFRIGNGITEIQSCHKGTKCPSCAF